MHAKIKSKLSFANVVSLIALFVALGGAAYAGGLITGKVVKNNSITGKDVRERSLGAVPNALKVGGIPPSEIGAVGRREFVSSCVDDEQDGVDCVDVDLVLPRKARVLMIATGNYFGSPLDDPSGIGSGGDNASRVTGGCHLTIDGIEVGTTVVMNTGTDEGQLALNWISLPLDPGLHEFGLRCTQNDGALIWGEPSISAVMLGSG
jgi:hypothetical protein